MIKNIVIHVSVDDITYAQIEALEQVIYKALEDFEYKRIELTVRERPSIKPR